MAIKIGKWYITRNNPRELLLELRHKQDVIDKAIEYINNESWFCYKDNEEAIARVTVESLLKILRGSEDK